jgi:hypothetical protein
MGDFAVVRAVVAKTGPADQYVQRLLADAMIEAVPDCGLGTVHGDHGDA